MVDLSITRLKQCYGLAIYKNTHSLINIKETEWVLYFYLTPKNSRLLHEFYPSGIRDAVLKGQYFLLLFGDHFEHKNHLHCPNMLFRNSTMFSIISPVLSYKKMFT